MQQLFGSPPSYKWYDIVGAVVPFSLLPSAVIDPGQLQLASHTAQPLGHSSLYSFSSSSVLSLSYLPSALTVHGERWGPS